MAPRVVAVPVAVSVVSPWPLAVVPGPVPGVLGELLAALLGVPEVDPIVAGLVLLPTVPRGVDAVRGRVAFAVAAAVAAASRPTCLSSTGPVGTSRLSGRATAFPARFLACARWRLTLLFVTPDLVAVDVALVMLDVGSD